MYPIISDYVEVCVCLRLVLEQTSYIQQHFIAHNIIFICSYSALLDQVFLNKIEIIPYNDSYSDSDDGLLTSGSSLPDTDDV